MRRIKRKKNTRNLLWGVCLLFVILFTLPALSQTQVTIDGIDGLTFTKAVESYQEAVTDTFVLHMMQIFPDGLTLSWQAENASFSLFGNAKVLLDEAEFFVSLGTEADPGISIQNDALESVDFGFTADFSLKGLSIIPEALSFAWNKSNGKYDIYGAIQVDVEGDTVLGVLGDLDNPGIEIQNGTIDHINIGVTADFELKSLKISPDNLTFLWDKDDDDYDLFGAITVDLDGDLMVAILGDADNPGIEIKDGTVEQIDIGITEDFELKGLAIQTESLGFSWQKETGNDLYHLFGSVKIDIKEDTIGFSFGDMADPGLVFSDGTIQSLKISTSDDLHFGGMEVATENLTLEHHADEYHVFGKMFVKDMWKATIDLGKGPGSGVTLDMSGTTTEFEVEQASFDLGNIDLGAISIKKLKLSMVNNAIDKSDLTVEFPPGWEVGADMTISDGRLASMDINWEALSFEEAIEMPGTGAFITKMDGGVLNLEDPHNFCFDGKIGIAFGGPFKVGADEVAIVYMETEAKINRSELLITSDVKVGAYMDSKGTWHAVLGDGNLKIDLKWGHSYSLVGHLNIPPDPIIKTDLEAKLSTTGGFNALVDVHLLVPEVVPLIGGLEFGEADGAIHYDKKDPSSFAAGWVSIDLIFDTIKKGVKYNFKSKDISIIGAKSIHKVSRTAAQTVSMPSQPSKYLHSIYVTVDGNRPHFIQIKVKLKTELSFYLRTQLPGGGQIPSYAPLYLVNGVDQMTESNINYKMLQTWASFSLSNKDSVVFYIMPPGYKKDTKARLAAGEYRIDLMGNFTDDADIVSYVSHKMFDHPKIEYTDYTLHYGARSGAVWGQFGSVVQDPIWRWDVRTDVFDPDSAQIHFFYSKDGVHGVPIKSAYYQDISGSYDGLASMGREEYISHTELNPDDDLYFWTTINDGVNAIAKTDVQKIDYEFPLFGRVKIANAPDSTAAGNDVNLLIQVPGGKWLSINLDNGKKTNHDGKFGFTQKLTPGTMTKLEVDIPYGYEVDPSTINPPEAIYPADATGGYDYETIILRKKN